LAASVPSDRARGKISVLPCGVALDRFQPSDKMVARTELGLSANDLIFLLPSNPDRPEKRADRARAVAAANGAKLLTLGKTPPDQVAKWLNSADLVLIPSDREGFGLALLESLACETPVLTTNNGIAADALVGVEGASALDWDESSWIAEAKRLSSLPHTVGGAASASRWSSDSCAAAVVAAWRNALASS
jgi:glycosyltransferase involved in cell wall biosynthesis